MPLPLGSPTGGGPGTCTSLAPFSLAPRKTGFSLDRWMPAALSGVVIAGEPRTTPGVSCMSDMPGMGDAGVVVVSSAACAAVAPARVIPSAKIDSAAAIRIRIPVSFRNRELRAELHGASTSYTDAGGDPFN